MATTAHKTAGAVCAQLSAGGYGRVRPFAGATTGGGTASGKESAKGKGVRVPVSAVGCFLHATFSIVSHPGLAEEMAGFTKLYGRA